MHTLWCPVGMAWNSFCNGLFFVKRSVDRMSKKLEVRYQGTFAYHIYIEENFSGLGAAVSELDVLDRRAVIVTDEHVAPLYLEAVEEQLTPLFSEVSSIVLPAGEAYKNVSSIETIYEQLIKKNLNRKDVLVALGGGVIGDMTGFAAATYMRGIRFIQIPTTLLAQVDSSIGGKTGVDFQSYKNMVGAFHMPSLVYSSISALKTLDAVQYASGMGEVIKHALIQSRDYLDYLKENASGLAVRDMGVLEETVYQSNLIKRAVVEEDPKEQGIRATLNFGHTLGHAIEKCSNFSYSHGQCVAFGTLCAMRISGISEQEMELVRSLMAQSGLATKLKPMPVDEILAASRKDKKMDKGQVKFILLNRLGEARIDTGVTDEMMRSALTEVMG